jgi:hypothetical protein
VTSCERQQYTFHKFRKELCSAARSIIDTGKIEFPTLVIQSCRMGIRSMVQFAVRVAAFAAIVCLSLQAACTIGVPWSIPVQAETLGDSGCHESSPPTKNAPDSSHICCSGDHSPDALLSATATSVPLALDGAFLSLTSALPSFALASTHFPFSFSPPHRPLSLRI